MTFQRKPASMRPTVSTAASSGRNSRETMVCRELTMAVVQVMASTQEAGSAPWPPLPWIQISNWAAPAILPPAAAQAVPEGTPDHRCMP